MDIQESHTESKQMSPPEPANSTANSCRKKISGDGSFVANLRDHIHEFISTPMEDHKACLKTTIQKMFEKFPARSSSPKEGESLMPSQPSAEN